MGCGTSAIKDNYKTLEEVTQAIRKQGLESSNLIFGIDYTKSNMYMGERSFQGRSLHDCTGPVNPYMEVIEILGKTLEDFDDDHIIPTFGFGDVYTTDKSVFPFYPDRNPVGFQEVLHRYREITPGINLSGPTNFAPLINQAIEITKQEKSYHILVIVTDGQVTNERATAEAIVNATSHPISIICIGVGDGPWDEMHRFDDKLPKRKFDNFQFVEYNAIRKKHSENFAPVFALHCLMEIPEQFLANIFGGVYRKGNILFTPDGKCVLSPVGNHILVYNLKLNNVQTFPFETRKNIVTLALSPDCRFLIASDVDGRSILVNYPTQTIITHINFKSQAKILRFSPDSKYLAVSHGSLVQVWRMPETDEYQLAPLILEREFRGSKGDTTSIEWDPTSQFILIGSEDSYFRMYPIQKIYVAIDGTRVMQKSRKTLDKEMSEQKLETKMAYMLEMMKQGDQVIQEESMEAEEDDSQDTQQIEADSGEDQSDDAKNDVDFIPLPDLDPHAKTESERKAMQKRLQRRVLTPFIFCAHHSPIVTCFFSPNMDAIYALSRDGMLTMWRRTPRPEYADLTLLEQQWIEAGKVGPHPSTLAFARSRWSFVWKQFLFFGQAKAVCAAYGRDSLQPDMNVIFIGMSNGTIRIVHPSALLDTATSGQTADSQSLTIAHSKISAVAFDPIHGWIALGANKEGLLSVWDWKNESIVLRQAGHGGIIVHNGKTIHVGEDLDPKQAANTAGMLTAAFDGVTACGFSSDGTILATGASDGKVKIWSVETGYCVATFAEQMSTITSIAFLPRSALAASSKDGTTRLYDLKRYRVFRVLVPPSAAPFSHSSINTVSNCTIQSICTDPSGTLLAGACQDVSGGSSLSSSTLTASGTVSTPKDGVAVWSVQTGQILDFSAGHSLPVTSVDFSQEGTLLASGSWDGDIRVWDIYEKKGASEPKVFHHASEVLMVRFTPDSRNVISLTRRSVLSMWNLDQEKQIFSVDISPDCVGAAGLYSDKQDLSKNHFTSFTISPDGSTLVAVGHHPFACLYDLSSGRAAILVKRFRIQPDRLFPGITREGMREWERRGKKMNKDVMDEPDLPDASFLGEQIGLDGDFEASDSEADERMKKAANPRSKHALPAAQQYGSKDVAISSTGTQFAVATGRGLFLFDSDRISLSFDPSEIDESVTPDAILSTLSSGDFLHSLRLSLRLGEFALIVRVLESLPVDEIQSTVRSLLTGPSSFVASSTIASRFVSFVAYYLQQSPHLERNLLLVVTLLKAVSESMEKPRPHLLPSLRSINKWLVSSYQSLSLIVPQTNSLMQYICTAGELEGREEKDEST
ncbi:putative Periodic tryptophan protein 2 like protein [Blattamonas nauphoetae]|uniref:Periodic tryptophan protein 2 like protein n=1 Tax=Blattamonas nauphoetae TaxID=2049346 RepID=A0ABQ9YBY2_9EUKA|nr:putative Periodic tryptophan protein 2 like protein [Blattamonas nauphoetae]